MKIRTLAVAGAAIIAVAAPAAAYAHFILQTPNSWIVENNLGDPQKAGPCGGATGKTVEPTGKVTEVMGGELLRIAVKETIYHPGFFRVALAVNSRDELPKDPEDTTREGPRGPISVSAKVDPSPKAPVLADGLWTHRTRVPQQEFETYVKIPNINCDHCTLQVIQFMEEHGVNTDGRFTYHHCADIKITASKHMKIDAAWPRQKAKSAAKPVKAEIKASPATKAAAIETHSAHGG
jgi:hypothetical protein